MIKMLLRAALLATALVGSIIPAAYAADEHGHEGGVTDPCVGTIDKAALEKVLPTKPPYSPYAGRNFPTRPLSNSTSQRGPCRRSRERRWEHARPVTSMSPEMPRDSVSPEASRRTARTCTWPMARTMSSVGSASRPPPWTPSRARPALMYEGAARSTVRDPPQGSTSLRNHDGRDEPLRVRRAGEHDPADPLSGLRQPSAALTAAAAAFIFPPCVAC